MEKKPHTAIAISRQMGSGGTYIGYLVAKELRFKYIDREILRQAAQQLGTDATTLETYDERSSGLVDKLIKGFSFGAPEMAYAAPISRPVYDKDLFSVECRVMNGIVDRYNAVIVGRGGFHALKDRPEVVRVFIHAPKEFRVKRVMTVQNISDVREARSKVERSDQRRAKFLQDTAGVDWTDARNYHLCIDASVVGFPTSVETIVRLVRKKESSD